MGDQGRLLGGQADDVGEVVVPLAHSRRGIAVAREATGGSTNVSGSENRSDLRSEILVPVEKQEEGPFAFVHQNWFDKAVSAIIVLNMLVLILETDYPEWPLWHWLNGFFLACYIVELGCNFAHSGARSLFWTGPNARWMVYDAIIVAIGMLDFGCSLAFTSLWVASGVTFGLMRALMLSRVCRLYRVVRMHSRLHDFVGQLTTMFTTFVWILGIIFLFCFVLSIVLTRLLGHGVLVSEDSHVAWLFKDIPSSLYALFQLCTADDWGRISFPVIAVSPWWRLFFVGFITFNSWTMLSLLTAVASETMITGTKNDDEVEPPPTKSFMSMLYSAFDRADADKDGLLDKDEFVHLMMDPTMRAGLLEHGIDLRPRDLPRTWDTFDLDESGQLTIEEVVEGLGSFTSELKTKHVNNVSNSLKDFAGSVLETSDEIQRCMDKLAEHQDRLDLYVKQHQIHHDLDHYLNSMPICPIPAESESHPDTLVGNIAAAGAEDDAPTTPRGGKSKSRLGCFKQLKLSGSKR